MTLQCCIDTLAKFIPNDAVPIVADILFKNKITLRITRARITKLGDYTRINHLKCQEHCISVNSDLDKYSFLWVLLHEIAHYQIYIIYNKKVRPHGAEWQNAFAYNLTLFNEKHCFPMETEQLVKEYCSRLPLRKVLENRIIHMFKEITGTVPHSTQTTLESLPVGSCFQLRNRIFRKLEERRTRCKCLDINNNHFYLVSLELEVQPIDVKN